MEIKTCPFLGAFLLGSDTLRDCALNLMASDIREQNWSRTLEQYDSRLDTQTLTSVLDNYMYREREGKKRCI